MGLKEDNRANRAVSLLGFPPVGDPVMHCRHCHSVMIETYEESDELSKQVWRRCSACARVELRSTLIYPYRPVLSYAVQPLPRG